VRRLHGFVSDSSAFLFQQIFCTSRNQQLPFLADSKTYESRLCYIVASVVVCTEFIVAKRCVLEQKLLLTASL